MRTQKRAALGLFSVTTLFLCGWFSSALPEGGSAAAAEGNATGRVVGWRGDGSGTYPRAEPPTEWGPDKNVVWKTPLSKPSNASPVIVGDRIFICADPFELLCVSKKDGKILWRKANAYKDTLPPNKAAAVDEERKQYETLKRELRPLERELRTLRKKLRRRPRGGEKTDQAALKKRADELKAKVAALKKKMEPLSRSVPPRTQPVNGYSTPTPTSDGKCVYVLFCNGVAACYDLEGQRRWARFVEKPTNGWGHSASPLLVGGKLLIHVRELKALDTATGKTVWSIPARPKWGSPVAARIGGQDAALTPGGLLVRVADGKVLAHGFADLAYAAPVVQGGVVYYLQNGGKALRLPKTLEGNAAAPRQLWKTTPKKDRYYASAAYLDGLIYAVTRGRILSAVDTATGKVLWEKKLNDLKGTCYPSVTVAGKYVFVSADGGQTAVLAGGKEYKLVALNRLELFRSSPVFEGDRLYIRAYKHLYCLGAKH